MRSIRTRITALTLAAILISILSFGFIGIYYTNRESNRMSAESLSLICENRRDTLNEYLFSIEQSVSMISRYAIDSLDIVALTEGGVLGADGSGVREIPGRSEEERRRMDRYFDMHLDFIENAFRSIANHTNGMASCYYRINPEITTNKKGFFFTKKGVSDFQRIEMTELQDYDTDDINHVGWYFIPLKQGRPSWIEPYNSAKLEEQVVSYAIPLYKSGTFIGVIGMDIAYDTLVTQIRQFTNFETGFFALTNEYGRIYYHPEYEMGTELGEVLPQLAASMGKTDGDSVQRQVFRYEKGGKKWQMTYSTLANGMNLVAAVQESEINATSVTLTRVFLIAGGLILLVFIIATPLVMRRVTVPLVKLTTAARRLSDGDYDVELDYAGNDETGVLTKTFSTMRDRLKSNIDDLSSKAFTDDLTGVKSKHAYVEAEEHMDKGISDRLIPEFAVVLFDLNDLKDINDSMGHDAGDAYIKEASRIICERFKHSPVYRIGGDEFVAILTGVDYANLETLFAEFEEEMDSNMAQGKIAIASGYGCYDPGNDTSFHAVFKRADANMYRRKNRMKDSGPGEKPE